MKKIPSNVIITVLLICAGVGFIWGGMLCATKDIYGLRVVGIIFAIIGYMIFPIATIALDKYDKEE